MSEDVQLTPIQTIKIRRIKRKERERKLRGGQYDFSLESYEDIRDQNFLERDLTIERDPQKEKS